MKHEKIRASIAHKCTKCLVDYLLNGQDENQGGSALMGTLIHNGFIPYYEKIIGRRIVYREKALENEYFTGHIDGYIKAENKLFELKTVNSWKFQKIKEPFDEHITQINIYMAMMGIKKAHLVYLNRDNGEHKAFDIDFTPIIYKAVEHKAKEAIELAKKETDPDEIVLDEYEFCDPYCKFKTKSLYKKPEGEKELQELQHKDELIELYQKRQSLAVQITDLETQKKEAEERIKQIMSEENTKKILDLGISFIQSNRTYFDSKTFKAKYPELYSNFTKTSISQSLRFPKIGA